MTEAQTVLSRRAVACPKWRWMPGMLTLDGFRLSPVDADGDDPPDLSDPATLGCLLALVREAWESPKANVSWVTDDKCMVVFDTGHAQRFLLGDTEAEALVVALESAP